MVDLDKQVEEITAKLREKDESERKKAEQEWRASMQKDTAGHTLEAFRMQQSQIAELSTMIEITSPLVVVHRVLRNVAVRLDALEKKVVELDKKITEASG